MLIDNINIELVPEQLAARVRLNAEMPEFLEFAELLEQVKPLAAPKALFVRAAVTAADEHKLTCDSGGFNCPLLARLAGKCEFIFPFIATCGREMEDFGKDMADPLHLYWLDFLKEYALGETFQQLKALIRKGCDEKQIVTSIVPMDDEIWPVSGLREVFAAFSLEDIKRLGVELTEYSYMIPAKTRAGVFFPADKELDSCSLCNLNKCKTCQLAVNKRAQGSMSASM